MNAVCHVTWIHSVSVDCWSVSMHWSLALHLRLLSAYIKSYESADTHDLTNDKTLNDTVHRPKPLHFWVEKRKRFIFPNRENQKWRPKGSSGCYETRREKKVQRYLENDSFCLDCRFSSFGALLPRRLSFFVSFSKILISWDSKIGISDWQLLTLDWTWTHSTSN